MSHKIFISYRRFDTAGTAGRLDDGLSEAFGENVIFRDVHDIPAGVNFRDVLDKELHHCEIVLVLIGQHYTSVKDEAGQLRLHNPNDFVHMEVATAMQMKKIVIPVLVDGAGMPKMSDLPEALQNLVNYNAVVISHDRWKSDVDVLIEKLEYHLGPAPGKQQHKVAVQATIAPAKSSSFLRTLGPMAMGGVLTLFLLIVLAISIPAMMEEPEFTENTDNPTEQGMEDLADATLEEKQPDTYEAGFTPPTEYDNEAQTKRIEPKKSVNQPQEQTKTQSKTQESGNIVNTGGYGLPTTDEQTDTKTDYWGFEEKKSLGDMLVGTWEQTYPATPTHLREYFGADGAYANSYQKGLFYIVVSDVVQINGTNAFQIVSMNGSGTEMELKSLAGGGLICKYRKIF